MKGRSTEGVVQGEGCKGGVQGEEYTGGSTGGGIHLIWLLSPVDYCPSLLMSNAFKTIVSYISFFFYCVRPENKFNSVAVSL